MPPKKISNRTLLPAVIIGIALSPFLYFYGITQSSFLRNPVLTVTKGLVLPVQKKILETPAEARVGLPIRLKIPAIGVDALVEYVGLTTLGDMAVPKGPSDVAWFQIGPRPGETGSAVISGHFGWKNDLPAVFDDLYKLKTGDSVFVLDEMGAMTNFIVREIRTYGENDDATRVFGSNDGRAHLNLITCQGSWNATKKSYSERLVVFADKKI
jgi:LPXTG-site transpeptidase (sortase) family protein